MRTKLVLALTAATLLGGAAAQAQDAPKAPEVRKEHTWLKQLEGEWDTESEMIMAPGQTPVKGKGTETVRSLGGYWSVTEMKGECMGVNMVGVMTVGYDAASKKYVGTWVCNMCDNLWKYEGTVNGNVLTLNTEGPSPADPSKRVKMRDVIEVKGKDHKVLRSEMQGDDGKWVTFMTANSRRKK